RGVSRGRESARSWSRGGAGRGRPVRRGGRGARRGRRDGGGRLRGSPGRAKPAAGAGPGDPDKQGKPKYYIGREYDGYPEKTRFHAREGPRGHQRGPASPSSRSGRGGENALQHHRRRLLPEGETP